ncbi:S16 family serine protease [Bacillus sinesaloumensis]|uniref:S16 family serine protease n=1 Tax=Litchfieldia sinesaloumensis TaxID=1926280 RepID=UPI0009889140|nr:S16 family serine protease [Bacillus sinesaloumensis]
MSKYLNYIGIAAILLYVSMWLLYLFDAANAFILIGVLLVLLLFLVIVLIIYRNANVRIIRISTILLIIFLIFDLKLLHYESITYHVSIFASPVEVVEESGIHLMVVNSTDIEYIEDKNLILDSFKNENKDVLNLQKIDNTFRYKSKNGELVSWILKREDEFSKMVDNINSYLAGNTTSIDEFLKRKDLSGDSAGLGLALSALIAEGELLNNKTIGITGALKPNGDVLPIGMVEEKVRIAEKKRFPYIIVPSDNAKEANQVKQSRNLNIEIFDVNHIDQAVTLIQKLNAVN